MKDVKDQFSPLSQVKLSMEDKTDIMNHLRGAMRAAPSKRKPSAVRVWRSATAIGAAALAVVTVGGLMASSGRLHFGGHESNTSMTAGAGSVSDAPIGNVATDKGITVTITNVTYDTHQLSYKYSVTVPKGYVPSIIDGHPGPQAAFNQLQDMTINGATFDASGGNHDQAAADGSYQGDGQLMFSKDMPSSGTLAIQLHKIGNVSGNWAFQIPLLHTAPDEVFTPNVSRTFNGATLVVRRISVGPISTVIDYDINQQSDAKGQYKYDLSYFSLGVFDVHHKMLSPGLGDAAGQPRVNGNVQSQSYRMILNTPATKPATLYFEPTYTVMRSVDNTKHKIPFHGTFPITIDSVKGTTVIKGIDFMKDKTLVHVYLDPKTLEHPDFYFEDGQGNTYKSTQSLPGSIIEYPAMDKTKALTVVHQDVADNESTSAIGTSQPMAGLNLQVSLSK